MLFRLSPLDGTVTPSDYWGGGASAQPWASLTFETGHLSALGLAEERQLVGDGLQHLDQVGQEEDDLDVMVG